MIQKLFSISVVLLVAVFSAVALVFIFTGLVNTLLPGLLSERQGITAISGGFDLRLMLAALCGALALVIAAVLIFLRSKG
jgi:hypothetical protein